jgi:hypothetical protein
MSPPTAQQQQQPAIMIALQMNYRLNIRLYLT